MCGRKEMNDFSLAWRCFDYIYFFPPLHSLSLSVPFVPVCVQHIVVPTANGFFDVRKEESACTRHRFMWICVFVCTSVLIVFSFLFEAHVKIGSLYLQNILSIHLTTSI